MLLSAVSVLVVAQSSSEIPEGLMKNPVFWKTKLIGEDWVLLGCDAASLDNLFPTFQRSIVLPASWIRRSEVLLCRSSRPLKVADEGTIFLRNVWNELPHGTASYARKTDSSATLPWKPNDSQNLFVLLLDWFPKEWTVCMGCACVVIANMLWTKGAYCFNKWNRITMTLETPNNVSDSLSSITETWSLPALLR